MGRRGELVIAAAIMLAVLCALIAGIGVFTGRFDVAAYVMGLSCFLVLMAVYLEVYSHRG